MVSQINTHQQMLDEILDKVNNAVDVPAALKLAYKQHYVKGYLELTVNDNWCTVDIDEVVAKQYNYHRSMAGSLLLNKQTWNIVTAVIMNKSLPDKSKSIQIKALFEMLFEGEQKIFDAILKKDLTPLYPNITFENINLSLNDES